MIGIESDLTDLKKVLESLKLADWIEVHKRAIRSNRHVTTCDNIPPPFNDVVLFAGYVIDGSNNITITLLEVPYNSKIVFTLPLSHLPWTTQLQYLTHKIYNVIKESPLTTDIKITALNLAQGLVMRNTK